MQQKYPCLGYKDPQSEPGESYDLVSHVPEGHEKASEENAHIDTHVCSQISVDDPVTGFTDRPLNQKRVRGGRARTANGVGHQNPVRVSISKTLSSEEMCQKAARDLGFQYDTNWPDGVGCKLTKISRTVNLVSECTRAWGLLLRRSLYCSHILSYVNTGSADVATDE